jgi:hypothetical protein
VQRRLLLLLALLAVLPAPCFAALSGGTDPSFRTHTLEALTATADLVAIATTNSHPVRSGDEVDTLRLQEVLKAPPGFKGQVIYVGPDDTNRRRRFTTSSPGTRLVFVKVRSWDGTIPREWALLDLVNLSSVSSTAPVAPFTPDPADSLYAPQIFDGSLTPITSRQKLLDLTRAECAHLHSAEQVRGYWVRFPLCFVLKDERLPSTARLWVTSPNPNARMLAARYFANTSDPAEVPLLRSLLTDDHTDISTLDLSPWTQPDYIIRQAAADALTRRHEPFIAPNFSDTATPIYGSFPYVATAGLLTGAACVFFATRRAKSALLRRRPGRLLPLLIPGFVLTACASVLITLAWYRSQTTADDFVFAKWGKLAQVTCVRDSVLLQLGTKWPLSTGPVHISARPDITDEWNPWATTNFSSTDPFFSVPIVDAGAGLLDFLTGAESHGSQRPAFWGKLGTHVVGVWAAKPPYRTITYSAAIVIVAHRWLYLPASLPLLLAIAINAPSHLRRQRRARRGQCMNCGYSLFGLPPDSVCPECGTAPNAKILNLTAPPPPQM